MKISSKIASARRKRDRGAAKWLKLGAALVMVAQLSGCALLRGQEAPRETFELSAPQTVSGLSASTSAQVLVKIPTALDAVNSDRIVLRPTPRSITYLAGAQWSDTVPKMVQVKLVQAFENTGATGATAKPGDGLVIDFQLVGDIRRFEVRDGQAQIEMSMKLLSDRSGQVLETRIFRASASSGTGSADDVVEAFDRAFSDIAQSIIRWTVQRL
ncbi:MAG: ABC-type transport auxiliary lipoprotein family protein [Pseudomonadota bacterium]